MKLSNHKLILSIIALAALLRFWNLGSNPPGLYWDEVSLGYNAYSILKTAHDEHNEFLPIARFKAFGDYKPPGYIYATVPSVAIFGLNNFAVRFPSALAGSLTVFITFLLVKQLFPNHFLKIGNCLPAFLAGKLKIEELSALLLAVSPWHLQLSRVAFEANLATLLNALAIYLFLKSRQKPWLLVASAISFTATIYTFNSNRLLTPLLGLILGVLFFKHLLKNKKQTIIAALVAIILTLPLLPHLRSPEGKLRWNEVNIFSDLDVILESNQKIAADGSGPIAKIAHHRYLGHARNFVKHYFDHFDFSYLFLRGDSNPRFSVQDVGELYLIHLPLLLAGLFSLFKQTNKKSSFLLLGWFLLGPVPAATARETPHALRTLSMLPAPQIIIALGIFYLLNSFPKQKKLLVSSYALLITLSFMYFQITYYHYSPQKYAGEWLTSYSRLVTFLKTNPDAQAASQITVIPDLGRPYIYFLFYNQYPPDKYAHEVNRTGDVFGFFTVNSFDKYRFKRSSPEDILPGDIYVVRTSEELPGFQTLTIISDTNNTPQFRVLKRT